MPPLALVMIRRSLYDALDEIAQDDHALLSAAQLDLDFGARRRLEVLARGGQSQRRPRLAFDRDDDVARCEAGLGRGAVLDDVDDLEAVGTSFDPDAGTIEGVGLAVIRVLLEIHLAARIVEGDVEL